MNINLERLQKFLAGAGIASRRKAEELIAQGRVKVNGITILENGVKVDPKTDHVEVDDKEITEEEKVYLLLYKPVGFLSTVRDDFERPTVMDLVKDVNARLFPVGRLDYQTEGLLLMTNDGDFAYRLTHPKHEKEKVYQVTVNGDVSEADMDKLRNGVELEDGMTAPAKCQNLLRENGQTTVSITIHQGKNRQIRRMFDHIGYKVLKLKRTAIDFLALGKLKPGEYRLLTPTEINEIMTL